MRRSQPLRPSRHGRSSCGVGVAGRGGRRSVASLNASVPRGGGGTIYRRGRVGRVGQLTQLFLFRCFSRLHVRTEMPGSKFGRSFRSLNIATFARPSGKGSLPLLQELKLHTAVEGSAQPSNSFIPDLPAVDRDR